MRKKKKNASRINIEKSTLGYITVKLENIEDRHLKNNQSLKYSLKW